MKMVYLKESSPFVSDDKPESVKDLEARIDSIFNELKYIRFRMFFPLVERLKNIPGPFSYSALVPMAVVAPISTHPAAHRAAVAEERKKCKPFPSHSIPQPRPHWPKQSHVRMDDSTWEDWTLIYINDKTKPIYDKIVDVLELFELLVKEYDKLISLHKRLKKSNISNILQRVSQNQG